MRPLASRLSVAALLAVLLATTPGCGLFEETFELEATVSGLVLASTRDSEFRAYEALESAIQADGQAFLATRVEFSEAARQNGIDLLPTRIALINAAEVSQPLVAADPLIALEFPQPLLLYSVDDERIVAGYNTAAYLTARYDVAGQPALDKYEERWQRFVQVATSNAPLVGPGPGTPVRHEGIVEATLDEGAQDAFRVLTQVVRSRDDVQLVARYDHTAEGGRPALTMLLNQPETSALLAVTSRTAAIDALLRIVVFEDASGATHIAFVDPAYTAQRHGIAGTASSEVTRLRSILDEIIAQVQSPPTP
ncbi:MAG: hypothetical protein AAGF99_07430 [Bacteroidota bacterium]